MPKTIFPQITMMCPTGLGNPDAPCRFHRASNNMTPDGKCPTCKLDLVKSTDSLDKITMTVMGEEDIEPEIEEEDKKRGKENKPLMNTEEKTAYRTKRKKDITEAIKAAKQFEDI